MFLLHFYCIILRKSRLSKILTAQKNSLLECLNCGHFSSCICFHSSCPSPWQDGNVIFPASSSICGYLLVLTPTECPSCLGLSGSGPNWVCWLQCVICRQSASCCSNTEQQIFFMICLFLCCLHCHYIYIYYNNNTPGVECCAILACHLDRAYKVFYSYGQHYVVSHLNHFPELTYNVLPDSLATLGPCLPLGC